MGVFSIDVQTYVTAYITAATEEDARALLREHFGTPDSPNGTELGKRDLWIADNVVISPAVTFYGPDGEPEMQEAG